jgi:hypothetical protein
LEGIFDIKTGFYPIKTKANSSYFNSSYLAAAASMSRLILASGLSGG